MHILSGTIQTMLKTVALLLIRLLDFFAYSVCLLALCIVNATMFMVNKDEHIN